MKPANENYQNMSELFNGWMDATANGIGVDAGGRQRVSQITTLLDGKVVNGHTDLLFQEVGTGTQGTSDAKHAMSVSAGQYAIFQTRRYHLYLAGKSEICECTFDGFAPQDGVTKRFGAYSSNNSAPYNSTLDGIYVESSSGSISLNVQRNGVSKLNVDIAAWSGYASLSEYQSVANWDNFTVVMFDWLWLGGAILRMWLKTSRGFVLAHVFHFSGNVQDTMMATPCKPLRYELRSSTGAGSFRYICSQVATEGSTDESGIIRSVHSGHSVIAVSVVGTKYPIKAIRKNANYRCVPVSVQDFGLFVSSTNDRALYTLEINPTLSAPLTYSDVPNSAVQEATGNGTITVSSSGSIIAAGYLTQNSILPTGLLKNNFLSFMGISIADVPDEYVLCITPATATIDCHGALSFKEF